MKFSISALTALGAALLSGQASASPLASGLFARNESECIAPRPIPEYTGADFRKVGMVLFRSLDMIDVFGPLDPLQILSLKTQKLDLHLIAETMEPVTTEPSKMNPYNSTFWPTIPPTNTFDDDLDLDLLIVPGGPGARAPNLEPVTDYIAKMYPKVKVLMTVCTGASLAAQAGVLDGRMATTNKAAWDDMIVKGPDVDWVSPARYIIDGDTWSSSGVTSSLDLIFAFIETYWGKDAADIAGIIEHEPREWNDDPFAEIHGVEPTDAKPCEAGSEA